MFLETDVQPPLVSDTLVTIYRKHQQDHFLRRQFSCRAVNPPGLEILRIDRERVIEQNTR